MHGKVDHRNLVDYSIAQVADVRQVLRLLPVFFASAAYFCLYNAQMGNLYVQQVRPYCAIALWVDQSQC